MKPNFRTFLSILLFPAIVSASDPALLQKISGTVELKPTKDAAWTQAQPGSRIPSGGQVRTGADGRAELKFQNKASVWLKPATSVAIDQKNSRHNQITLGAGTLKIRVPHLARRERFEVRTPTAVASVRGTVFTIDEKNVQTFFGQVNMRLDSGKKFDVPQGAGFDGKGVSMLSQLDEVLGLENWTPGLSDEERRSGLVESVERRQEIRAFSDQAIASHKELVDSIAGQVKDADFAAGRTLTDVHGNLVRVEQRLDRPDDHTIQVTNIVIRTSYASGGLHHYAYNGANTSRVDALIAKTEFNMALPDQINAFPGFFSAQGDAVKVDRASVVMANMGNANEIFAIGMLGRRNASTTDDKVNSDLYLGTLTGPNARKDLFNLSLDGGNNVAGLTRYKADTIDAQNTDAQGGLLYNTSAKRYVMTDLAGNPLSPTGSNLVWIASDNYVIDNGGKIHNVSDYVSGGTNFTSLIDNTAGETVVYAKTDDGTGHPSLSTDYQGMAGGNPGNKNIDLVIIPDLAFSIIKSLASSGSSVSNNAH